MDVVKGVLPAAPHCGWPRAQIVYPTDVRSTQVKVLGNVVVVVFMPSQTQLTPARMIITIYAYWNYTLRTSFLGGFTVYQTSKGS